MITDFERVPEIFVEKYRPWLNIWAQNFRKWGPQIGIPLHTRDGPVLHGIHALDEHGNPPFVLVRLKAERFGNRMIVSPCSNEDADLIARHVAALCN